MNWLGQTYQWLWFRSEFWLTPINRRPYTFIMRDLLLGERNKILAWVCCGMWFAGFGYLSSVHPMVMVVPILSAFILGHVVWGTKYIEGQQEFPTYLGD